MAALENFDLVKLCYLPQRLSWQPIGLSLQLTIERDAPPRDSVSSSVSSWRPVFSRRLLPPETQKVWRPCDSRWRGQPIFSRLSTLLLTLPPAVCVLILPVSVGLLSDVFQVPGFFSSIFSAS